jgi:L-arabinokinase
VRLAMDQGPDRGIYGAKITGGGSGGAVALLCSGLSAEPAIEYVRREYAAHTGINPRIIAGSSAGAVAFGARLL